MVYPGLKLELKLEVHSGPVVGLDEMGWFVVAVKDLLIVLVLLYFFVRVLVVACCVPGLQDHDDRKMAVVRKVA